MSISGPRSPTIALPLDNIPPLARYGILGIFGMLNPILSIPKVYFIQSGVSIFMEFISFINVLIPFIN